MALFLMGLQTTIARLNLPPALGIHFAIGLFSPRAQKPAGHGLHQGAGECTDL
jgi:hypothetical protein